MPENPYAARVATQAQRNGQNGHRDESLGWLADLPVEHQLAALRAFNSDSQARGVQMVLAKARAELAADLAAHNIDAVADWQKKSAAIRQLATQFNVPRDVRDDATEFQRRAQRALGLAIREGQARGVIGAQGHNRGGPRGDYVRNGQVMHVNKRGKTDLISASSLLGEDYLRRDVYAMTDGVSDEQFEEALAEARAERKLTRANVAAKCYAKAHPPGAPEPEPPPAPPRKVRKTAGARKMMTDLVITINSFAFVVEETDPAEVDLGQHRDDIKEIFQGMAKIGGFLNAVKEQ